MEGLEQDTALILELVRYSGDTVAAIAKKVGVAPSTLQRPANGTATTRLSQRTLEKLQRGYPSFPNWTSRGDLRDRQLPYRGEEQPLNGDTLSIPMVDISYGMGGSFLDGDAVEQTSGSFPRKFIRLLAPDASDDLFVARGVGDSMMPTIHDSDLLLIDRQHRSISMTDQVWALVDGGIGMVKRVRVAAGVMTICSDNDSVSDYIAEADDITVVGRVVAKVGRL